MYHSESPYEAQKDHAQVEIDLEKNHAEQVKTEEEFYEIMGKLRTESFRLTLLRSEIKERVKYLTTNI